MHFLIWITQSQNRPCRPSSWAPLRPSPSPRPLPCRPLVGCAAASCCSWPLRALRSVERTTPLCCGAIGSAKFRLFADNFIAQNNYPHPHTQHTHFLQNEYTFQCQPSCLLTFEKNICIISFSFIFNRKLKSDSQNSTYKKTYIFRI